MSAVGDGIFVSDLEKTYFMGGGDPGEAVLIGKADYPGIPPTGQKIDVPVSEASAWVEPAFYGHRRWRSVWAGEGGSSKT